MVTVSRDAAGRWFVSILVEATLSHHDATENAIGVDAGIASLLTFSTGEKVDNPNHERRERDRLAKAQRNLARKAEGSNNREKARRTVARVYARIVDRCKDFLHKVTTRLVRENQTIVIEDLNVRGMMKNRSMARVISDASWTQFREMALQDTMPLNVRKWTCSCGVTHDRDVNAARNILAAGLAVAACGDGIRPNRRQSVRHLLQPPFAETEAGTVRCEPDGKSSVSSGGGSQAGSRWRSEIV